MKSKNDSELIAKSISELEHEREVLSDYIAEVDAFIDKMRSRKIYSLTLKTSVLAYDRAQTELDRWSRAIRDALKAEIAKPVGVETFPQKDFNAKG